MGAFCPVDQIVIPGRQTNGVEREIDRGTQSFGAPDEDQRGRLK
jgi:hypothetical protein